MSKTSYRLCVFQPLRHTAVRTARPVFTFDPQLHGHQQVEALVQLSQRSALRALLTDAWKCYPVLQGNGGRECIGTKWKDVYNFFHGQEDPLLVSCQNLLDTLSHMLLRGEDLLSARQRAAELEVLNANMNAIGLDNPQPRRPPQPRSTAQPQNPAPSSQTASTASTPARPARSHEAFACPTSGLYPRLDHLRDSSPEAQRHPPKPSSTSHKSRRTATSFPSAVAVDSDFEHDRPEASARETARNKKRKGKAKSGSGSRGPGVANDARDSGDAGGASRAAGVSRHAPADSETPPPIFLNIRDARGQILSSLVSPPPFVREIVPSLSDMLDEYFDRHGLPNDYILNVYTAYAQATSRDQFARTLANVISMQEAKWLWPLIELPVNRASHVRNFARP
ncbi:hypothetical protein BC835DRAFT_1412634 [Cytidiella melzeri]|nr:hypothetical protein BC835DRAFT_1412634 [Cytidiella melzeri]